MKLFLCIFGIASFFVSCFLKMNNKGLNPTDFDNLDRSRHDSRSRNIAGRKSEMFARKLIRKINVVTTLLQDPSIAKEVDPKVKEAIVLIIHEIKEDLENYGIKRSIEILNEIKPNNNLVNQIEHYNQQIYAILNLINEKADNLGTKAIFDVWEKWESCEDVSSLDSNCKYLKLKDFNWNDDKDIENQGIIKKLKDGIVEKDKSEYKEKKYKELLAAIDTIKADDSVLNQLKKVSRTKIVELDLLS